MNAIGVHAPDLPSQPVSQRIPHNRCWDDKKSMPPCDHPDGAGQQRQPDGEQAKVYNLIARQYLMQFCPDAVFRKCVIELEIAKANLLPKRVFWRKRAGVRCLATKSVTKRTTALRCRWWLKTTSCCEKGKW